jgi:acyl-CoA hydrolase
MNNDEPRSYTLSLTTMTEHVLPSHANALGTVFGGTIMSWIDVCGAVCAQRHARKLVVTAFVDDLVFQGPVRVGEVVKLQARVNATFRTSMELEVFVEGENPLEGRSWPCVHALLTFVAVDEMTRKPVPVPPLLMEDDDVRYRQKMAEERRAHRLTRAAQSRRDA